MKMRRGILIVPTGIIICWFRFGMGGEAGDLEIFLVAHMKASFPNEAYTCLDFLLHLGQESTEWTGWDTSAVIPWS